MRLGMLLLITVVLVAGCSDDGTESRIGLLHGAWELSAATISGEEISLLDDHRITATISGNEMSGRAACNSYGAAIEFEGSTLVIHNLAMTAADCGDPRVMALEQTYTHALPRISTGERSSDRLVLSGDDVELVFALLSPPPTAELVGVTWILSEIIDGDTVSSPAEGADDPAEPATLILDADGTLSGHTGCRELTGEYTVRGDEVLFTFFSALGECIPELELQDGHIVTVLGDGFTAEMQGTRLTIRASDGLGLMYRAQP